MHAQARDEVAVELHVKFLRGAAAAGSDDDVGDDDFALDIGKAPAGFGFKPGDDGLGGAQFVFADVQLRGQAAGVVVRQQLQRAVAGAELERVFSGGPPGCAGGQRAQAFFQLQGQAFGQVARAHARGFQ